MSPKDAAYKILHQVFLPSSAQHHLFLTPQKRGLTISPLCSLHTNYFLDDRTSTFSLAKLCLLLSLISDSKYNSWKAVLLTDPQSLPTLCFQMYFI